MFRFHEETWKPWKVDLSVPSLSTDTIDTKFCESGSISTILKHLSNRFMAVRQSKPNSESIYELLAYYGKLIYLIQMHIELYVRAHINEYHKSICLSIFNFKFYICRLSQKEETRRRYERSIETLNQIRFERIEPTNVKRFYWTTCWSNQSNLYYDLYISIYAYIHA